MPESLADMALLDARLGEAASPLEAPLERLCALCFASDARFAWSGLGLGLGLGLG